MNQFKDIFTGKKRSEYKRAVTVQKCMRAGGKHNDLENVGRTGRHQTFFEMLGNFSFGDYFKEEAITYGWDWVTRVLKLPGDRLYATVYEDDDDAYRLWEKLAPELRNGRILRFGKKDNYWSMGDIGPNGPCSEIHFDRGKEYSCRKPACTVNCDCERYVEIWNLVFMQFNTKPDGTIERLPKPSVDTGAGLERITTIMQNVPSNYETDVFWDILVHISQLSGKNYSPCEQGVSHRVIADHLRALTFCIADGAGLSNEGRGYVLRKILRRAALHGQFLGLNEPFIYRLVPTLVNLMGSIYPEIRQRQTHIENVIRIEEEGYARSLTEATTIFNNIINLRKAWLDPTDPNHSVALQLFLKKALDFDKIFDGEALKGDYAFEKFYATYGIPPDSLQILAERFGLKLDMAGFEKAMEREQEKSREAAVFGAGISQQMANFIESLKEYLRVNIVPTIIDSERERVISTVKHAISQSYGVALVTERSPFRIDEGQGRKLRGRIEGNGFKLDVFFIKNHQGVIIHVAQVVEGNQGDIKNLIGAQVELSIAEKEPDVLTLPLFYTLKDNDISEIIRELYEQPHTSTRPIINKHSIKSIVEHVDIHAFPVISVVTQETPFYIEAGGQISDIGIIRSDNITVAVYDLASYQGVIIHIGRVTSGTLEELSSLKGKEVTISIDSTRRWDIMRNHTATHLLHAALRKVLGGHVHQSGSYVGPDKLRFDFSHFKPMTPDEIAQVEKIVNEKILEGKEVHTDADVDIETAKESGAMAIFGEKYGSKVRVVSVDDFSKELCGGTHVENVSQIGPFIITLETGIAAGIRRIEAITGRAALEKIQAQKATVTELSRMLNRPEEEIKKAVEESQERLSELQKENKKLKSEKFAGGSISVGQETKIGSLTFRFHNFGKVETEEMAGWVDSGKSANSPVVTAAIGNINGKATFMASSSPTAKVDIGKFSKEILGKCGGRGGGKENFVQGTVPADIDPDQLFKEFENKLKEKIKA